MTIDIKCENCKREFPLDMNKARSNSVIKCPRCRAEYHFKDDNFKKINDQLEEMLKNIEIKINL